MSYNFGHNEKRQRNQEPYMRLHVVHETQVRTEQMTFHRR